MRIGYYPGCSLLGSSREFDESVRALTQAIGLELVEVPDWNCCGASSAHVLDHKLSLALPARILAQAEAAGLTEILAPCAACYNRLASARAELAADPTSAAEIAAVIELPVTGNVKVVNILEVLDRFQDTIREKTATPFTRKVACYYGCLLVRPPKVVAFDRPEDPRSMDRLMAAAGAEALDWNFKTECCGAAFSVTRTDLVARMSGRIVADAARHGAEAIVVACPMCQSNLDMRRPEINASLAARPGVKDPAVTEAERTLPVIFITQALGLAMGLDPVALGLQRHMVPALTLRPALQTAAAKA
jgi:heterodisulfide reductase subunit B